MNNIQVNGYEKMKEIKLLEIRFNFETINLKVFLVVKFMKIMRDIHMHNK